MEKVAVSVIIPNYNHGQFLKQRIDSVLNQTYQDFELILLDDFSTDNSREIFELYKNNPHISHIIYNESNSGSPFKQWQVGINLAQGKYIWIAESDDWASYDFLEELISNLSHNTNVGICFCDSNWSDEFGNEKESLSIYSKDFKRNGKEEIKKHLIKYNTIQNASAALIRTDLAKRYIHSISQYKSCGDWRLYLEILQESDILFVGKKLNNFRWYHNNTSNNASKKGLWVIEGLKLIAYSSAYKIPFTKNEIAEIFHYWWQKPRQFKSLLRLKLQFISFFYLMILRLRIMTFHRLK